MVHLAAHEDMLPSEAMMLRDGASPRSHTGSIPRRLDPRLSFMHIVTRHWASKMHEVKPVHSWRNLNSQEAKGSNSSDAV